MKDTIVVIKDWVVGDLCEVSHAFYGYGTPKSQVILMFVSKLKTMPNNAVKSPGRIVLFVGGRWTSIPFVSLVLLYIFGCLPAQWVQSNLKASERCVLPFGDKQTSKSHET